MIVIVMSDLQGMVWCVQEYVEIVLLCEQNNVI